MRRAQILLVLMAIIMIGLAGLISEAAEVTRTKPAPATRPTRTPKTRPADALDPSLRLVPGEVMLKDNNVSLAQYQRFLKSTRDEIDEQIAESVDCTECSVLQMVKPELSTAARQCKRAWEDFYSRPELDLRINFGYFDNDERGTTQDRLLRQALIDELVRPCDQNLLACGFRQDPKDADVFTKIVDGPKVLANGAREKHTVKLRLTASSYSDVDRLNQIFFGQQEQAAQTEKAKHAYYSGREEGAEYNAYFGHARKSAGPAFEPAVRRANGTIDYDYYVANKHKEGRAQLSRSLVRDSAKDSAARRTKIEGFFACDAPGLFLPELRQYATKSGLLVSDVGARTDVMLSQQYAALDSMLWMRCEPMLTKTLNAVEVREGARINPRTPVHFQNFFSRFSKD